jgi:hypothetical protein
VAAAGLERMVHLAGDAGPHHGDGTILGAAIAVLMLAMVAIGAVNPQRRPSSRIVALQVALAGLAAWAGTAETLLTPAVLVLVMAMLCTTQLAVSRSQLRASA